MGLTPRPQLHGDEIIVDHAAELARARRVARAARLRAEAAAPDELARDHRKAADDAERQVRLMEAQGRARAGLRAAEQTRPYRLTGSSAPAQQTWEQRRFGDAFMRAINVLALVLLIVGGLNWGLVGLFEFDLVAAIFGGQDAVLARVVYVAVGIAAIVSLGPLLREAGGSRRHAV